VTLAPGEQKSVLVRAAGEQTLNNLSLSIQFNPAVATVVAVRPILLDGGVADARIDSGHVLLDVMSPVALTGARAVAEILLQGTAPGKGALLFDKAPAGAGLSQATVEVR
jgi:hypothetical protein